MKIIQYVLSVALALAVTLVAYLIAPILPLFADKDSHLPSWLKWFEPTDTPICGDESWAKNQGAGKSLYWRSVNWLWRNPGQGCDSALGATYWPSDKVKVWGNPNLSDIMGISGICLITLSHYFHLIVILPIGFGKCVHLEAGWRMQQIAQDYEAGMANKITRQLVSPFPRIFRFGQ